MSTDRKEYMAAYRAANKDKLAAKARERRLAKGPISEAERERRRADAWFYRKQNKDKIKEQRWWRERKKVLTPEQKERRREINRAAKARYYERHKDKILGVAKERRALASADRNREIAASQARAEAGWRRAEERRKQVTEVPLEQQIRRALGVSD